MLCADYFQAIRKISNGYLIETNGPAIQLIFLTDDLVRIRASFDKKFKEESYVLTLTAWEDRLDGLLGKERRRIRALDIPYEETDKMLCFKTAGFVLKLYKKPFGFKMFSLNGELLYSDLLGRAFVQDQLGRVSHYNEIDLQKDHFYGFGEKTGRLDKKGRRMMMGPKDAIGHDPEHGDPLYKHIPFYLRINETDKVPVGLFYHNTYDAVFDMGCEISGYWPRYSYYMADGGDIDLFLIHGEKFADVVKRYTDLTGKQAFPPLQSLGYTASTMYYAELKKDCDREIYQVIDKHRQEEIPIDNFWLASGYSTGEKDNLRYTFHWNTVKFPQPDHFLAEMEQRGINVIPNLKPGVLPNHPYAGFYEERKAFVRSADAKKDAVGTWWGGKGRFIDFTNPAGREAWKLLLEKEILQRGVHTVWNDNCEYDSIVDRDAVCSFDGAKGTMAALKVMQSNLMAHTGREALQEIYPEQRPYIISRAGFAGIQRYAQTWAGDNLTDWRTPKFNINTILGMGLSGVANNGCDIGGFAGSAPEPELLLRWIQNGIFQPRFVINSANDDNTATEPWMYEENVSLVREAYRLRYRLLPYLYSLMYEAAMEGTPVLRPLFYEFQEDAECYRHEEFTFMFGKSLLIANVFEKGAKTRRVYLPKGSYWYYWENMERYEGGQFIEVPVQLSSIPIFVRGNAILPTTQDIQQITRDKMKTLELLVASDENSEFTLYEDDGYSERYKQGDFLATQIMLQNTRQEKCTRLQFRQHGQFPSTVEDILLKVINRQKGAFWVSVAGHKLLQYLQREQLENAVEGWYYHPSLGEVWVKYKNPKRDYEVMVSFEKFDLIGMSEEE